MFQIREAVLSDLPGMLEIYNHAIVHLNATFDLEVQTLEQRKQWFQKYGDHYPLIVALVNDEVAGYCSLSPFRDKEAYARTTEISIYISDKHQGKGLGSALMEEILKRAEALDFHTIIGGITTGNEGSVKLHEKFGFSFIGRFKEVGYKFNTWQDVDFYQLILKKDGDSEL